MKGRIQLPQYTAAVLRTANPILLSSEIVYESDTARCKRGDGTTQWNSLPYATDGEVVPPLLWKVIDSVLYVKPAADAGNPVLKRCKVGILHYKNAHCRHRTGAGGVKIDRPQNVGFKVVQDKFTGAEVAWTAVRIDPKPFKADAMCDEWMPVISTEDLFERWVEYVIDPSFSGGGKFRLHRGNNIVYRYCGTDLNGLIYQKVSFYSGIVLFVTDAKGRRVEGPRSYFKVASDNSNLQITITHI